MTILLLIVLDPFGLAIMLPSLLKNVPKHRVNKVIMREMLIALCILLMFLFGGNFVLDILGLEKATLSISGAVMLFLIALGMLFPGIAAVTSLGDAEDPEMHEPFIVPIAVPLFAGPSGIAIFLLYGAQLADTTYMLFFVGSIFTAWGCSLAILLIGPKIIRYLGKKGSMAMERIVGILLILISVQMFFNGLTDYIEKDSLKSEELIEAVNDQGDAQ